MRKATLTITLLAALANAAPATAASVIARPTKASVLTQGIGFSTWLRPERALQEGPGYEAFAETQEGQLKEGWIAKGLLVSGFGLSVPSNATVEGLGVSFETRTSPNGVCCTNERWFVRLRYGVLERAEKEWDVQSALEYNAEVTPEGPWEEVRTLYRPTPAELDSPSFGVEIQPQNMTGPNFLVNGVNGVQLGVSYSVPAGAQRTTHGGRQ